MSSKELRRVGWSDALTRWEGRKSSFERIQDELETSENGKLLQELTDWKQEMNRVFAFFRNTSALVDNDRLM